ncbi:MULTISPECIES: metal ABC transporter solute-binding protein, Zn/Mn family [Roseobacteraceae]|jgi:manganese/zinc/iron transport system substrate-binding protein|nr:MULTISPECIES: zinc ABC transporter substrate-binding protein [Roseobacteraceae]
MTQNPDRFYLSRRAALGGFAALAASTLAPPAFAAAPLNVVATTGMIADVTREIGGDAVVVKALMGPGVDPHSYRQTRSDIVAMSRADTTLWHGLYLEAQMEDFFHDLGRKRQVFAVAEALPKDLLLSHADYENRYDPHVWMAPELFAGVVVEIGRVLGVVRPELADMFAANAQAYVARLNALDDYARITLEQVPPAQRVLLTAHDAFGYFGRAYGFEVIGIQGISTESEAGLHRVSALVDMIVSRGLGAVFVESSVSDRNMRALVEGAGARGHDVRVGGELYSDAMGQDGTYEGTYIGMIDHNVTTIARALGADVSASGMSGKLNRGA